MCIHRLFSHASRGAGCSRGGSIPLMFPEGENHHRDFWPRRLEAPGHQETVLIGKIDSRDNQGGDSRINYLHGLFAVFCFQYLAARICFFQIPP